MRMKGGERVYHGSGPKVDLDIKVYIIYLIRRYILPLKFYLLAAGLLDFASSSVTFRAMGEPGLSFR